MKNKIKEFIKTLGINEVGITDLNGKTAIVCLFPYFSGYEEGNLSVYCYSTDYHIITKEKLNLICRFLLSKTNATYAEGFADIGPEVDKNLAYASGLGFYGKNTLLINTRLGSYFFIGYVLTDLELEHDEPLNQTCLSCGKCINSCPGNALKDGFNTPRCASAINQKKGELKQWEIEIMRASGYAFGCDICQKVCPHNQNPPAPMAEFLENRIFNLTRDMFEGLSNKEFKAKYGSYAFSWRGKNILLRNIEILNE